MGAKDRRWEASQRLAFLFAAVSFIAGFVARWAEGLSWMLSIAIGLAIFTCLMVLVDRHPNWKRAIANFFDWPLDDGEIAGLATGIPLATSDTNHQISASYRPPHAPSLPVWIGLYLSLQEHFEELEALIESQDELTKSIQAHFDAYPLCGWDKFPQELARDLSTWHSNATELEALYDSAFGTHRAIGLTRVQRTGTPFDLEKDLPEDVARRYHSFRDKVNIWDTEVPAAMGEFKKKIHEYRRLIQDEARHLLAATRKAS